MKVVLVRPNYKSRIIIPPIGLGYLSSYLKQHEIETVIIDGLRDNLDFISLRDKVLSENPDVVGINCYTAFYKEAVDLSIALKKRNISCVMGGPHPTFLPYQTLTDSNADYVICGEGELALLALLKNNFVNTAIKGVYSLADLRSGNDAIMKAEVVEDLDQIPFPDWKAIDPNLYPRKPHGFFNRHYPVGIIMSTRGCAYNCAFCGSPKFYDRRIRYRSPENVLGEIKYLRDNFKIKEIHFFDDNLTFKREHIQKICRLIIENDLRISWSVPDGLRADKIDAELLRLMKESGCYYIQIGIESANEQILKNINKGETIGQIRRAIMLCDEAGISIGGGVIFGLPGETDETIRETIDFVVSSPLAKADFLPLAVLPGSEFWNALNRKFIANHDRDNFKEPGFMPEGLTRRQLLRARSEAFKRFYFNPKRFFKLIRVIKPSDITSVIERGWDYLDGERRTLFGLSKN